jgi:NAD(P)H-hydrate epimerase
MWLRPLARDEVRAIDRRALDEYGLPGLVLMENAGRGAAESLLRRAPVGPVVVCCGGGNNGGDGYVVARHLDAAGIDVRILAFAPAGSLPPDARTNRDACAAARIPLKDVSVSETDDPAALDRLFDGATWLVDALLGTGTKGTLRPPYLTIVARMNATRDRGAKILALDLPSGMDCDTGLPCGTCVRADATVTFVSRKTGFDAPGAADLAGSVEVVGIGVPRRLLAEYAAVRPPEVSEVAMHDGRRVRVVPVPPDELRVETGAIRFGDDRPGLFVRGDNAISLSMWIRLLADRLSSHPDPDVADALRQLAGYADLVDEDVIVRSRH